MNNKFFNSFITLVLLSNCAGLVACMPYEGNYYPKRRWQILISPKQEAIVDRVFMEPIGLLAEVCAQEENHSLNNVLLERVGHYKNIGEQRYFKDALYRSVAQLFLMDKQVGMLKDPATIIGQYITEQKDVYFTLVSIPPVISAHNEQARAAIRHAIQRYDDPEEQLSKKIKTHDLLR